MRTRFGLLGGVLVLVLGAGIAALAYQAGVSQGAASAASAGSVVVVGGGPWGFGIFGVLFGLFFLFLLARLVIGVAFGAFGRGRGPWGHGGVAGRGAWMNGPAGGPGSVGAATTDPGAWGPRGRWGDREAFVAEMHRHLHERDAAAGAVSPADPGTPAGAVHPADPGTPGLGTQPGA
jgi:hypothetical protein